MYIWYVYQYIHIYIQILRYIYIYTHVHIYAGASDLQRMVLDMLVHKLQSSAEVYVLINVIEESWRSMLSSHLQALAGSPVGSPTYSKSFVWRSIFTFTYIQKSNDHWAIHFQYICIFVMPRTFARPPCLTYTHTHTHTCHELTHSHMHLFSSTHTHTHTHTIPCSPLSCVLIMNQINNKFGSIMNLRGSLSTWHSGQKTN